MAFFGGYTRQALMLLEPTKFLCGGYTRQALTWFGPTKFLCENGGDVNLSYLGNSLKNRFKWTHCRPLQSVHEEMCGLGRL